MDAFRFVTQVYSLDTLDTRLTTSSHGSGAATSEGPSNSSRSARDVVKNRTDTSTGAAPSKWNTLEFYCYYAVFALVVPQMFRSVMKVSNRTSCPSQFPFKLTSLVASHPNYTKFEDRLSAGWIPGRKVVCQKPQDGLLSTENLVV